MSPVEAAACCHPIDELLSADRFRSLADPTRLALLSCLAKCARPATVGELAACCSVDLSVVSRHLSQLQAGGLIEGERSGRHVLYQARCRATAGWLRELAEALETCCAPAPAPRRKRR